MKCKDTIILIQDYLEGYLKKDALEEFLGHIRECKTCRKEFEHYQRLFSVLAEASMLEAPVDFTRSTMLFIREKQRATTTKSTMLRVGIFAALILLVVGYFIFGDIRSRSRSGYQEISNILSSVKALDAPSYIDNTSTLHISDVFGDISTLDISGAFDSVSTLDISGAFSVDI